MKKYLSLMLVFSMFIVLSLTASAANIAAPSGSGVEVVLTETAGSDIVVATVNLVGPLTGVAGVNLKIQYNTAELTPCNATGTEAPTGSGALTNASSDDSKNGAPYFTHLSTMFALDSDFTYVVGVNPNAAPANTKNSLIVNYGIANFTKTALFNVESGVKAPIASFTLKKTAGAKLSDTSLFFTSTSALKSVINMNANAADIIDNFTAVSGTVYSSAFKVTYVAPPAPKKGFEQEADDTTLGGTDGLVGNDYTFNGNMIDAASITECGIEITTPGNKVLKFPALSDIDTKARFKNGKFAIVIQNFDKVRKDGNYEIRAYYVDNGSPVYLGGGTGDVTTIEVN